MEIVANHKKHSDGLKRRGLTRTDLLPGYPVRYSDSYFSIIWYPMAEVLHNLKAKQRTLTLFELAIVTRTYKCSRLTWDIWV